MCFDSCFEGPIGIMVFQSVQFSCSVMSDSLWPHELQHSRPPCPSPTPSAYSNSCPSSWWCHPTISSCCPFLPPPIFPSIRVFFNKSALCIRWLKYWSFSFSISLSNEFLGLISFRTDWLDSQESSPTPQFKSISSLALSFLNSSTLKSIHDHWKNHSLD